MMQRGSIRIDQWGRSGNSRGKMTASLATVKDVLEIVLRHVDKETAKAIFKDLQSVPGNSSFRTTIIKLEAELLKR